MMQAEALAILKTGANVFLTGEPGAGKTHVVNEPVGGLTVVLVGDFFQLPPVSRSREAVFAYESASWRALNPLVCYLTEQYRQDDTAYLDVLSAIRAGAVEELHHERLTARHVADDLPLDTPKLYSHNADVDGENGRELAKLPGKTATFRMTSVGRENLVEGMSMDAAIIDLSRAFEYGQGYVALSRVRRLAGLYLLGLNARALEVHPGVAEKDREFRAVSEVAREAFAIMPPVELEGMQKKCVKAFGGRWLSEAEVKEARAGRPAAKRPAKVADRYADTLAALRERKALAETAKLRSLTPETIVRHIEVLAKGGKALRADYAHLLPADSVIDEIREALAGVEDDRLAPVYYKLGGRHSYETIRLARLSVKD